eukprot:m.106370 g.106370  ORF g.106370 m.106370 type:complete len:363 (+) comp12695_c0_seq1:38-1126(+)
MKHLVVAGFSTCPFHQRALVVARQLEAAGHVGKFEEKTFATREAYHRWLASSEGRARVESSESLRSHKTSPLVVADGEYVGGCSEIVALASRLDTKATALPTAVWPSLFDAKTVKAHDSFWDLLSKPGLTLSSVTRVAVAAQSRLARNCPLSSELGQKPFNPTVIRSGYNVPNGSPLTPGQVDLIHRTMNSAGRFVTEGFQGEQYYKNWIKTEGTPGQYVEILGVVVMTTQVDTFHIALGLPLRELPRPQDVDRRPEGQIDPRAGSYTGWTPTILTQDASGLVAETYTKYTSRRRQNTSNSGLATGPANIMKQLSAIPQDHAQFALQVSAMYSGQKGGSGVLTDTQVEFIASIVSKINDCAY